MSKYSPATQYESGHKLKRLYKYPIYKGLTAWYNNNVIKSEVHDTYSKL